MNPLSYTGSTFRHTQTYILSLHLSNPLPSACGMHPSKHKRRHIQMHIATTSDPDVCTDMHAPGSMLRNTCNHIMHQCILTRHKCMRQHPHAQRQIHIDMSWNTCLYMQRNHKDSFEYTRDEHMWILICRHVNQHTHKHMATKALLQTPLRLEVLCTGRRLVLRVSTAIHLWSGLMQVA